MKNNLSSPPNDLPDSLTGLFTLQERLYSKLSLNRRLSQEADSETNRLRRQNNLLKKELINLIFLTGRMGHVSHSEDDPETI